MQQNKAGEFQIPNSIHHPNNQKTTSSEVGTIYQEIISEKSENCFSNNYEKLISIADNIALARQDKIARSANFTSNLKNGIMGAVSKIIFFPEFFEEQNCPSHLTVSELMQMESEVGSEIFQSSCGGDYVRFFNESRNHWFFYREQRKENGLIDSHTIHYEVRDNGVVKTSDKTGPRLQYLDDVELENFFSAVNAYNLKIMNSIYNKNSVKKVS